jgi:large subunit ribosomal protein L30
MAEKTQVKVTLVKSLHGQLANIAASARGLGLRRIRQSVTVADTPENRGMINTAIHLLKVDRLSQ